MYSLRSMRPTRPCSRLRSVTSWRFSVLHLRPVGLQRPGARPVTCPAILAPNQDHLVDSVPPMFDYESSLETSPPTVRSAEDQLSDLASLTAELQDLMSELQQAPTAQWQATPDGMYILPQTDQVLKQEVSNKEISEGAQRRRQAREQRKQHKVTDDPRLTAARVPTAPIVTEAPSTSGRSGGGSSSSSSFAVSMPRAQIRITDRTLSFLGDDASDEELRQLEVENEAAAARLEQQDQQQQRLAATPINTPDFNSETSSSFFASSPATGASARATSARRAARSSQWGRKASVRASGSSSRGRDGGGGAVSKLMTAAGGVDLLNGDQEKELALLVQDCMQIERQMEQLTTSLGRPPVDKEVAQAMDQPLNEFVVRFKAARAAKNTMISSNTRLVISICKKYSASTGAPMQDLIAEGMNGLMRGVERFDPSKGFKFSTYAHWWVRQAITRSLSDQSRTIRLPSHMHEALHKVRRVTKSMEAELGRAPTTAEIAARANLSEARILELKAAIADTSSMDAPSGDKDDSSGGTWGDRIEDEDSMGSDEAALHRFLKADMEAVLRTLSEKEAGVVRLRFGLVDGTEKTLEDCGKYFGVTRERIRQIEAMAIRKLRARQEARTGLLKEYTEGAFEEVEYAARTSSGTKKSS